ncbi:HAUS augmin-like complex subunit 7 isoform X3 [Dermochelys coriacea]|uniref:HAUS augmin-like complex subunit 7 isoform X3 n=1 Tax=Dermochelys coriacea TaxID=27794 RepID=UPI0018E8C940|nr:HAUS augmin-like complex subunit 7 isoform X3 [Dermochelys coriacea]
MSAAGLCEWQRRWPIGAGLGARRAAGQDGGARGGLGVRANEGAALPPAGRSFPARARGRPAAALRPLGPAPGAAGLALRPSEPPPSESNLLPSRTRRRRRKLKGEASDERQLRFMEQLLDVIRYLDAITGTCSGDSTTSSAEESLRGAARKNEEFLREVFSSPSLPALLAPALPSCTADIKPLLLEEPAPHVRTQLSVRSSGKTLAELSRTLEEANAALERLRAESSSLRGGAEPLSPGMALQTLALAACDSHQLMAAFGQVYETELREHCGRGPAPRLSPCGPLAQHLQGTLTLCTQELQALAQLNDTSEQVVQTAEWRRSKGSNPTATLPVKMEELRRRYQACLAAAGELPG